MCSLVTFDANKALALNAAMSQLTDEEKNDPNIQHALAVRSALTFSNYCALFHLYLDAPSMGGYLMDKFVTRERVAALRAMCKAYVFFRCYTLILAKCML